ncbi:hypothetical protein AAVH_13708 [Aphelenchoides avenae]|nr:hypothetical protein AAVH_13708 [Aphelenchus avenae]
MAPIFKKTVAKGKTFVKKNSMLNKVMKEKGVKQVDKYLMCPWKMSRYRNALTYHHCDECREKKYHNEKKAVEDH